MRAFRNLLVVLCKRDDTVEGTQQLVVEVQHLGDGRLGGRPSES